MMETFTVLVCYNFCFRISNFHALYSSDLIWYLMIVVGPQIWTESISVYKNVTTQFQKIMVFENELGSFLESDLCMVDCQNFHNKLAPSLYLSGCVMHRKMVPSFYFSGCVKYRKMVPIFYFSGCVKHRKLAPSFYFSGCVKHRKMVPSLYFSGCVMHRKMTN